MAFHFQAGGCGVFAVAVFLVPGLMLAYFLHSAIWIAIWPTALVVFLILLNLLSAGRKVTAQQWTDELEKSLAGITGWEWDDATSVKLADKRLESVRIEILREVEVPDSVERQEKLRQIIERLRRGEIP